MLTVKSVAKEMQGSGQEKNNWRKIEGRGGGEAQGVADPPKNIFQSAFDFETLAAGIPALADFPMIPIHVSDSETLYSVLDWQRVGAKCMFNHFLKFPTYLQVRTCFQVFIKI
jgi:hypothetical protein